MKNIRIITLTAICMMTGMNLMADTTLTITNNTDDTITVALTAWHWKDKRTSKEFATITIASDAGSNIGTWTYNGYIETVTITDTASNLSYTHTFGSKSKSFDQAYRKLAISLDANKIPSVLDWQL